MTTFLVTIERTEAITFAIDAENADEAAARALYDGDEIEADTTHLAVVEVKAQS